MNNASKAKYNNVNKKENMATSRLSSVSIETCADEIDFQVDLRLT